MSGVHRFGSKNAPSVQSAVVWKLSTAVWRLSTTVFAVCAFRWLFASGLHGFEVRHGASTASSRRCASRLRRKRASSRLSRRGRRASRSPAPKSRNLRGPARRGGLGAPGAGKARFSPRKRPLLARLLGGRAPDWPGAGGRIAAGTRRGWRCSALCPRRARPGPRVAKAGELAHKSRELDLESRELARDRRKLALDTRELALGMRELALDA